MRAAYDDFHSSEVWKSVGPIVSHLPSKIGMERSNRPLTKILPQDSLVVKMVSLQAVSGAVWGRSKISSGGRSRENRPKNCTVTTRRTIRSRVPCHDAIIDVGEHFVKAAYFLKGYGPLVFSCSEKLHAISKPCQALYFRNVCSGECNCQWRSESESSRPGTESQGLCTARDSVVFTEV